MLNYISLIKDDTLRKKLIELHTDLCNLIDIVPASIKYHHNWTGGYRDHVNQVLDRAVALYRQIYVNEESAPIFDLDDVILIAYIHDLDKLFRYKMLDELKDGCEWGYAYCPSYDASAKVTQICSKYGIILENKHLEALAMHHGGWSSNPRGIMSPLAVIIHSADLISTFIMNHK